MAQKAIREYHSKQLLFKYLRNYLPSFKQEYQGIQVTADNFDLLEDPEWTSGYVAKPDQLFGKRGKNGLIKLSDDWQEITNWIKESLGKETTINKGTPGETTGVLDTFIIEPKLAHQDEYYISFKTERDHDTLHFSLNGGVEVEENWDQVVTIDIPFSLEPNPLDKSSQKELTDFLTSQKIGKSEKGQLLELINSLYQVFRLLDFTYLEINPFTFIADQVYFMDLVARLDDTAHYKNRNLWSGVGLEFPLAFGSSTSEAEKQTDEMDRKSGSALKFSLINPDGRIWLLTSGGGGSVVMADTVGDLGAASELGNFCDYSGNPTKDETQAFTDIAIKTMLESKAKDKVLIIGGGIANFTNIQKTFKGVVEAIKQNAKAMEADGVKIFVRRGGPYYKQGLAYIRKEVEKLGIPISVHGPEMYMTEVVKIALG